MSTHVDIVRNEWLAGFQTRIAFVSQDGTGGLRVTAGDPAWRDILDRPVPDIHHPGTLVYPVKESASEALDVLVAAYQSPYVFATSVHSDDECPFLHGEVIPMTQLPTEAAVATQLV
jgi:hypothetical protein